MYCKPRQNKNYFKICLCFNIQSHFIKTVLILLVRIDDLTKKTIKFLLSTVLRHTWFGESLRYINRYTSSQLIISKLIFVKLEQANVLKTVNTW